MKGCSSVGVLRFAVLLGIGTGKKRDLALMGRQRSRYRRGTALCRPEDAEGSSRTRRCRSNAPVAASRQADGIRSYRGAFRFIRELLPQDLKIEIEKLTIDDAMKAASFLSGVVGKAHARQMDEKTRARWAAELERHRTKNSRRAVMAMVERGLADRESRNSILEHCRRYPLQSVFTGADGKCVFRLIAGVG